MPELPEVETIKNKLLSGGIVGSPITNAHISWEKTLATHSPKEFVKQIVNDRISAIYRRGKFLLLHLKQRYLLMHLRMSGKLAIIESDKKHLPHERARIDFKNGLSLLFQDTRKFGRLYLFEDLEYIEKRLGLEPLSDLFDETTLRTILQKRRSVKALLLDQKNVAGLGNIYADEALFAAGIFPGKSARELTGKQISNLLVSIKKVLRKGIENRGTSLGRGAANYLTPDGQRGENQSTLSVYGRAQKPCPRCGAIIKKIKIAGRSTHFCPICQPF